MQKPAGRKIYQTETNTLSPGKNFDGEAHSLYGTIKEYMECGDNNGWNDQVSGINMIPDNIHEPNIEYKNLAMQYGKISIENILQLEKTFVNTPTREAHN